MTPLRALLAGSIILPPLAVLWGTEAGTRFTLYREPKLALIGLLGWTFLGAFALLRPRLLLPGRIAAVLRRPFFILFLAFLAWSGLGLLWVRVPENLFYEWRQYLLLFLLLAALCAWSEEERTVPGLVRCCLVGAMILPTAVGILQLAVNLPGLVPIDPGYGVRHASFMGYKNPMALALAGQLLLVLHAATVALRSSRRFGLRLLAATAAAAEVLYLATLQSRTALVAVAAGGALVLALHGARERSVPGGHRGAVLALLLAVVLGAFVTSSPPLRKRVGTLGAYVRQPATLLESDRGVYLRNTLAMVKERPAGVGLGDWQTWYPVFRRVDRQRAFTATHQARRAHGDHVQLLGEIGWPGLALWLGLLGAAGWGSLSRYWRGGRRLDLVLVGQWGVLVVAMLGDYLAEMPYHKLQLFLVCFLAVDGEGERGDRVRRRPPDAATESSPSLVRRWVLPAAVLSLAVLEVPHHAQLVPKSLLAGRIEVSHRTERAGGAAEEGTRRRRAALGERFHALRGHAKTFYRVPLVLAADAAAEGATDRGLGELRRAMALHPFHPGGFRVCAELLRREAPGQAAHCSSLHDYVVDEASDGFRRPYPDLLRTP